MTTPDSVLLLREAIRGHHTALTAFVEALDAHESKPTWDTQSKLREAACVESQAGVARTVAEYRVWRREALP